MQTQALIITDAAKSNPFSLGVTRRNADGKAMGTRISFIGGVPAGDVKKALKEADPSLKGKALTKKVSQVLRGDRQMAEMLTTLMIGHCHRQGFRSTVADLNKAGTKFTLKMEKVADGKEESIAAAGELSVAELEAILAAKKAAAPAPAPADNTINVESSAKPEDAQQPGAPAPQPEQSAEQK